MVWEDLKPSDILTRKAFENCIAVNSAIGGRPTRRSRLTRWRAGDVELRSTTGKARPPHPLLVNLKLAGFYLGEYHRWRRYAGGGARAMAHALVTKTP
jgi:dihydroxy-acid dehydratase